MPSIAIAKSTVAAGEPPHSRDPRTLVLRAGLLAQDGKTCFCLVTDISASGIRAKVYGSRFAAGPVNVRIADEDAIGAQIVWLADGYAGITFDHQLGRDMLKRLDPAFRSSRRRAVPRIAASARALIRMDGRNIPAELCDISSFGAKLRTKKTLPPDRPALLDLPDLPSLAAHVRWSDRGESGLAFVTAIPMQVIGHWIDGRLRVSG